MQVTITDGSKNVRWLNEIEYINGEVWGMIWQTECIARVDPKDGSVIGWLLMDGCDSVAAWHACCVCLHACCVCLSARLSVCHTVRLMCCGHGLATG